MTSLAAVTFNRCVTRLIKGCLKVSIVVATLYRARLSKRIFSKQTVRQGFRRDQLVLVRLYLVLEGCVTHNAFTSIIKSRLILLIGQRKRENRPTLPEVRR